MFAALAAFPFDDDAVSTALRARLRCQLRGADIYNAFERVAFEMFPGLAALWEELETRIGEPIRLAGAGPTLFWIGPPDEAAAVAERAGGLPCTVIETRTSPSLWRP
jgi:4-diphosphocytidyl-2C-methyl-D-erythritol kinase